MRCFTWFELFIANYAVMASSCHRLECLFFHFNKYKYFLIKRVIMANGTHSSPHFFRPDWNYFQPPRWISGPLGPVRAVTVLHISPLYFLAFDKFRTRCTWINVIFDAVYGSLQPSQSSMPDQTTQTVFKLCITYALAGWNSVETPRTLAFGAACLLSWFLGLATRSLLFLTLN